MLPLSVKVLAPTLARPPAPTSEPAKVLLAPAPVLSVPALIVTVPWPARLAMVSLPDMSMNASVLMLTAGRPVQRPAEPSVSTPLFTSTTDAAAVPLSAVSPATNSVPAPRLAVSTAPEPVV